MKKLWYSFIKELKLSAQSFYFYVEIILAVIIIALLIFLPDTSNNLNDEYIHLKMSDNIRELYLDEIMEHDVDGILDRETLELNGREIECDVLVTEDSKLFLIENEADMIELTKSDRPYVGATISINDNDPKVYYDYYLQGYESERLRNLYKIIHTRDLMELSVIADEVEVRSLNENYVELTQKETALPVVLTFNGSLMGMFIIASYIFLDKSEGVIRAYAITASKIWHYLASKIGVILVVSIVTSFLISFSLLQFRMNYGLMLILLLTSGFAFSALGLLLSSFYDNMNKAFAAVYAVMMIAIIPSFAYYLPSWQPAWVQIIPTHFLIQGFKEIMIQGDTTYVLIVSGIYLVAGIILFILADRRFKKTLTV